MAYLTLKTNLAFLLPGFLLSYVFPDEMVLIFLFLQLADRAKKLDIHDIEFVRFAELAKLSMTYLQFIIISRF